MKCAPNKSTKVVHRTLFRLKSMGFLSADIPIWYGRPTFEMVHAVRVLKLNLSPRALCKEATAKVTVLPKTRRNGEGIMTNLLKQA
ncbi:MAG: hypothetical protein J0H47_08900 [Gammaproteobacteria bacterium]|nr:hypothetical protein [Gammaproteobacteria bacterium]